MHGALSARRVERAPTRGRSKATPRITATPERVKVTTGLASTDIGLEYGQWIDGFCFRDGKWSAAGSYRHRSAKVAALSHGFGPVIMFSNSTGDAERRTLLATVNRFRVSREPASSFSTHRIICTTNCAGC